ncbi:glycosyltransferase family 2 protein [Allokutzneria sp. A3M-2-11 16]|uniref:glycosyltransferase n=1 Tax=Allokutzneria sp. A3M-2-11 16 TaxID=2962043 RepID=UPI0020B7E923|nr:glycosyltransferase family 2 protein [Allokutzneria sp. A3M-2-11 16]MCP3804631.1 glycosyltransferase family 2 protein [Allokutzneria sp. A3M-2-11 16]
MTDILENLTFWATLLCAVFAANSVFNAFWGRRRLRSAPPEITEMVSVLIPARNEALRISPLIRSLLDQRNVPRMEILVFDDESTDGTADVVRAVAAGDPRVRVLSGGELPPGWQGKTRGCHLLAENADPESQVFVFVDADVELGPTGVAALVTALREHGGGLLSAHIRQIAVTYAERLVQPAVAWLWTAFLPLRLIQSDRNPGIGALEGWLHVFDREAYRRCGGYAGVSTAVSEDAALGMAFARSGGRLVLAEASEVARGRLYTSWQEIKKGYSKHLCVGVMESRPVMAVIGLLLALLYILPPLAALSGSAVGLCGYLLGVFSRVVTARTSGDRVWPDAFLHPLMVLAFLYLLCCSFWLDFRGQRTWKGRLVQATEAGKDSPAPVHREPVAV